MGAEKRAAARRSHGLTLYCGGMEKYSRGKTVASPTTMGSRRSCPVALSCMTAPLALALPLDMVRLCV